MVFDYRNAYRYPGKGHWFDFWNCRILIPEKKKWFFLMPHIISTPSKKKSFFYFCSSQSDVEMFEILEDIKASEKNADIRWKDNLFSSEKIKIHEKGYEWDFSIDSICSDGTERGEDLRAFNVREKLHLRNLSFIHRVPTMKGYANGYIKNPEEKINLNNAIVYQAKNHGPDFPDSWTWLHVNLMPQFPNASFEIGTMPGTNDVEGIFRWTEREKTKVHASFLGDQIFLEERKDDFIFSVKDKNGAEVIEGKAFHGKKKEINFPRPNGGIFSTPESFDGYVSGSYLGNFFESDYPALGKGLKKEIEV
tara:strand:- start:3871 stop:4791 length:921 start_codon:yes stop_codon:yes gene_type:complete